VAFPWLALAIFAASYTLISLRRLGNIPIERPAAALLGGLLMVLFGVLTPTQAFAAMELNTLALLLGMMVLAAALETTGLYAWLAVRVALHSRTQAQFLWWLMVATAVLSALILNDTVVLLFTPVLLRACQHMEVQHPERFLIALALAANIGSVATEVGNPQNAYIALRSGIPFLEFSAKMLLPTVVSLVLAFFLIRWLYKDRFARATPPPQGPDLRLVGRIEKPRILGLTLGVLGLVFVGFSFSQWWGMPLSLVALGGAILLFTATPFVDRTVTARSLFARVDWNVLMLFVGLFVLLEGVEVSGLLTEFLGAFGPLLQGDLAALLGISAVVAVLSNLVSNVPAVLLLSPLAARMGGDLPWLALAAASTLAGNATLIGAAANLIVAEVAEARGTTIRFWEFVRVGLPVTVVTLVAAIGILWLQELLL
jgi:Na+/H+ antiporter NhaD/arsenite permease-like protein